MARRERDPLAAYRASLSEAEFQATVVELAERLGWRVFAVPDWARDKIMASVLRYPRPGKRALPKGWPDLVLLRSPRLVVAELKTERGRLSGDQFAWMREFEACGIPAYCWRPSSWDEIEDALR